RPFAPTPLIEPRCSRTLYRKPDRESTGSGEERQRRRELGRAAILILGQLRCSRKLSREPDEAFQLAVGGARVDGGCSQLDAFLQVACAGTGDEGSGRIHEDDVALRAGLAAENVTNDLGILLAVAAEQVADRGAPEAEVLGPHRVGAHDPLADLGHPA